MLFCDFQYKLLKLNRGLRIDTERQATPYYKEFPVAGLYYGDKYLFGVPHQIVPEYTLAAINFTKLQYLGYFDKIEEINRTGLAIDDERILWRGYRAILNNLVRMGYINQRKAEKEFNIKLNPKIAQLPRNYINKEF